MKNKGLIALGVGAILLIGAVAGATVYMSDKKDEEVKTSSAVSKSSTKETTTAKVVYDEPRRVVQNALPACDDDNIVGKVIGGAAGGVAGSQFGKGNGKTAATIGGTVGGVLLGEEYIPTRNVTCR